MESVMEMWAWYSTWWHPGDNFRFALLSVLHRSTTLIRQYYHHCVKNGILRVGFLYAFRKKLLPFNKGNKVFDFWIGIPGLKFKTMNDFKRQPWFPCKQKNSGDPFLYKLSEKIFTWMDSEKGNRIFAGIGHNAIRWNGLNSLRNS